MPAAAKRPRKVAAPPAPPPPRAQRAVQSVEVGGQLLLALAGQPGPMLLKDLAAAAGLSAARAHPYLVSYGRLGLVQQEPGTGRYGLGPAALQIGLTCLMQLDPLKAAAPVAQALAERTGQAVALAVWGSFGPTIVRVIEAARPLHITLRAGSVMDLFGTATGRAFLGTFSRERLRRALPGSAGAPGLAGAAAPRLSAAQWQAEAEPAAADLRAHGLVRAVGRPIPGVNAFSAPVFDHEGQAVMVITALGHQDDVPAAWASPTAQAVREAAARISHHLGGPPSQPSLPKDAP